MSSEFLVHQNQADTLAAAGAPAFTGVQFNTSSQALPITLFWGTRRIAPQIIWKADIYDPSVSAPAIFNPSPPGYGAFGGLFGQLGVGSGSSIGSNDPSSNNQQWFWPTIFALCEGPVETPPLRLWNGGAVPVAWADSTDVPLPGNPPGAQNQGVPSCPFYDATLNGTSSQTAWAWIAANPGGSYMGQALAYRNTALIVSPTMVWGNDNKPPPQQFELQRIPGAEYGADR